MLRKIAVNLNIMTTLSIFWILIFDRESISENLFSDWGWVFILALITTIITCFYLQISRFEKEAQKKSGL